MDLQLPPFPPLTSHTVATHTQSHTHTAAETKKQPESVVTICSITSLIAVSFCQLSQHQGWVQFHFQIVSIQNYFQVTKSKS